MIGLLTNFPRHDELSYTIFTYPIYTNFQRAYIQTWTLMCFSVDYLQQTLNPTYLKEKEKKKSLI